MLLFVQLWRKRRHEVAPHDLLPNAQTKETLTLRASSFGSKCELPAAFINRVARSGINDIILNFAKFKNEKELKKSDGAKRSRLTGNTCQLQRWLMLQMWFVTATQIACMFHRPDEAARCQ